MAPESQFVPFGPLYSAVEGYQYLIVRFEGQPSVSEVKCADFVLHTSAGERIAAKYVTIKYVLKSAAGYSFDGFCEDGMVLGSHLDLSGRVVRPKVALALAFHVPKSVDSAKLHARDAVIDLRWGALTPGDGAHEVAK